MQHGQAQECPDVIPGEYRRGLLVFPALLGRGWVVLFTSEPFAACWDLPGAGA